MDRINVIDAKKYKQMLINGAPEGGEPNQKSSGWGFRATSPDNFTILNFGPDNGTCP